MARQVNRTFCGIGVLERQLFNSFATLSFQEAANRSFFDEQSNTPSWKLKLHKRLPYRRTFVMDIIIRPPNATAVAAVVQWNV
jgi:hypothetical protein